MDVNMVRRRREVSSCESSGSEESLMGTEEARLRRRTGSKKRDHPRDEWPELNRDRGEEGRRDGSESA